MRFIYSQEKVDKLVELASPDNKRQAMEIASKIWEFESARCGELADSLPSGATPSEVALIERSRSLIRSRRDDLLSKSKKLNSDSLLHPANPLATGLDRQHRDELIEIYREIGR